MPEPRPHPLSRDFQWTDREVPLRELTEAQRDAFNAQGFIKMEGAFSADEVAAVTAAIDPLEAVGEQRLRQAGGTVSIATADVITFTTHIAQRSAVMVLMGVELILNAIGLNIVAFWRFAAPGDYSAQIFVILVITIGAVEMAIGLALMMLLFRQRQSVEVDGYMELKR